MIKNKIPFDIISWSYHALYWLFWCMKGPHFLRCSGRFQYILKQLLSCHSWCFYNEPKMWTIWQEIMCFYLGHIGVFTSWTGYIDTSLKAIIGNGSHGCPALFKQLFMQISSIIISKAGKIAKSCIFQLKTISTLKSLYQCLILEIQGITGNSVGPLSWSYHSANFWRSENFQINHPKACCPEKNSGFSNMCTIGTVFFANGFAANSRNILTADIWRITFEMQLIM